MISVANCELKFVLNLGLRFGKIVLGLKKGKKLDICKGNIKEYHLVRFVLNIKNMWQSQYFEDNVVHFRYFWLINSAIKLILVFQFVQNTLV